MVDGRNLGFRRGLEGVAVGVLLYVSSLQIDCSSVESCNIFLCVLAVFGLEDWLIRLELVGAIAKPHGVDVSSVNKGKLGRMYQFSLYL